MSQPRLSQHSDEYERSDSGGTPNGQVREGREGDEYSLENIGILDEESSGQNFLQVREEGRKREKLYTIVEESESVEPSKSNCPIDQPNPDVFID